MPAANGVSSGSGETLSASDKWWKNKTQDVNTNAVQERQIEEMSKPLKLLSRQQIWGRASTVNLLCDTSEVIFGPILGEPLASQLGDMPMHQPKPQSEDLELIITSVNFRQHSAHYLRRSSWGWRG